MSLKIKEVRIGSMQEIKIQKEYIEPQKIDTIVFITTNSCNLRCLHCLYESSNPSPNELDLQEIKKVIKDAKSIGLKKVHFSGGEVFLKKDILFDLIEFCKKLNIDPGISTNGTLINEQDISRLKRSVRRINITIFGVNKKTHDKITRISGSLEKTENTINMLTENGLSPTLLTVPMKPNYKEITKLVYKAQKMGIKEIRIINLHPKGRAVKNLKNLSLSKKEAEWLTKKLKKASNETDVAVGVTFCEKHYFPLDLIKRHKSEMVCPCLYIRCHVGPTGEVFPCALLYDFTAGNVREKPINEIWSKAPIFQLLRYSLLYPPEPCKSCDKFSLCRMGCRAQTFFETGSLVGPRLECLRRNK